MKTKRILTIGLIAPHLDPKYLPRERLFAWIAQPRNPILCSPDPLTKMFIRGMLTGQQVDFIYIGGSTPGLLDRCVVWFFSTSSMVGFTSPDNVTHGKPIERSVWIWSWSFMPGTDRRSTRPGKRLAHPGHFAIKIGTRIRVRHRIHSYRSSRRPSARCNRQDPGVRPGALHNELFQKTSQFPATPLPRPFPEPSGILVSSRRASAASPRNDRLRQTDQPGIALSLLAETV